MSYLIGYAFIAVALLLFVIQCFQGGGPYDS